MNRIMLEALGKMRDAFGVLYEASGLIVAHAFGEYAADHAPPPPQTYQSDSGVQNIFSEPAIVGKTVAEIIEEVKKLILELKLKGTVREHRNGLLKFTSPVFGCVYGRTKEEFEKKVTEKITQLAKHPQKAKQRSTKPKAPLFSEYYKTEYYPYKKKQNLVEGSLNEIDVQFRFIVEHKLDKRLTEYTSKMIEDFLYSIPSTSKRKKVRGVFNNMFKRAVALGYIKTNPCDAVETVQHDGEQGKAFSFDEQEEFFPLLFQNEKLTYEQKCYFTFLYLTGARRTEGLTVRVEDVDFKNKVLHICGTKTDGSDRRVPLTPLVEKLLLSLKPKRGVYFPFKKDAVDRYFRKVWETSKGHKPHDLRHTFGTVQHIVEKVDIKTVSLWMGHSTTKTTLDTYDHPEQLDIGIFLRGDMSDEEKTAVYREKYGGILMLIKRFVGGEK